MLVLARVAALESMLEGGTDYSSLSQLTSYQTLAATCGAVFAQAAALCGVVSNRLSAKLKQAEQQGDVLHCLQQLAAAVSGSSGQQVARRPGAAAAGHTPTSNSTDSSSACTSISVPVNSASSSSSAPPSPSTPVCSAQHFDWALAKQHLVLVLDFETQQYYTALVQAAHDRPFKLDPARSITSLMFLCMLSMGVIEACQKLQGAAKAVLGCRGDSSSALAQQPCTQQTHAQTTAAPAEAASTPPFPALHTAGNNKSSGSSTSTTSVPSSSASHCRAQRGAVSGSTSASSSSNGSWGGSSSGDVSGTRLLLRYFLMLDVGLRIWDALTNQIPAALQSKACETGNTADRDTVAQQAAISVHECSTAWLAL